MDPTRSRIFLVLSLQTTGLLALFIAQSLGGWPLSLCLLLGFALLWLPWFVGQRRSLPGVSAAAPELAALTRDLSRSTSHNALSAAGVSYSVQRLVERLESQLAAAEQIVGSAEVMIHTERATSSLARQAMDAATRPAPAAMSGAASCSRPSPACTSSAVAPAKAAR